MALNERSADDAWLHFRRKIENWLKNGRSTNWAILVQAVLRLYTARTRRARLVDLPFFNQFLFFLQKRSQVSSAHLSLSTRMKFNYLFFIWFPQISNMSLHYGPQHSFEILIYIHNFSTQWYVVKLLEHSKKQILLLEINHILV